MRAPQSGLDHFGLTLHESDAPTNAPTDLDTLADAVRRGARSAPGRVVRAPHGLAVGQQADFAVLAVDGTSAGLTPSQALAGHLFGNHGRHALREVWVAGRRRIRDGAHELDRVACEHFVTARGQLLRQV